MIKPLNNKWFLDIQPGGRSGRRIRKFFKRKSDALAFERSIIAKHVQGMDIKPAKETRRISELIALWYDHFGISLSSGYDSFIRLNKAVKSMGDPVFFHLKACDFIQYRTQRLDSGIDPKTLNKELALFRAVFSSLLDSGFAIGSNPFKSIKPIRCQSSKMVYLELFQVEQLLESLEGTDAFLIASVCLATGARWGESQALDKSSLSNYQVHFHETKSKIARSVPISAHLYDSLLFRLTQSPFTNSYSTISRRLDSLGFSDFLPKGQRTHILRHTFASHFMMNGGNILTLQKILGHASLDMTLRYAHLSPNYLSEVLQKNPLSSFCWQ